MLAQPLLTLYTTPYRVVTPVSIMHSHFSPHSRTDLQAYQRPAFVHSLYKADAPEEQRVPFHTTYPTCLKFLARILLEVLVATVMLVYMHTMQL